MFCYEKYSLCPPTISTLRRASVGANDRSDGVSLLPTIHHAVCNSTEAKGQVAAAKTGAAAAVVGAIGRTSTNDKQSLP